MDSLPIVLSSLSQNVSEVPIRRSADMSRYGSILLKFGLALTQEEFRGAQNSGQIVGHVGFEQSVAALAIALKWKLDDTIVEPPSPAFLTRHVRVGKYVTIAPSTIAAVRHSVWNPRRLHTYRRYDSLRFLR